MTSALATTVIGQEAEIRGRVPGFRTDLGLDFSFGGHNCVGGGADFTECRGNGVGWSLGGGLAIGLEVRPIPYFSIAMDISLMNLAPYEDSDFENNYKRLFDLSVGPVFTAHIPIRIKSVLLEPRFGLKLGFVNGFIPVKEGATLLEQGGGTGDSYKAGWEVEDPPPKAPKYLKQFGPDVTGIIGFDVYVLPGFGFGPEVRLIATMYQQTCEYYSEDSLCRGMHDDLADEDNEQEKTPFKVFFGLRIMKYF